MTDFERALMRLIDEPDYRQAVTEDWTRLTNDFDELTPQELLLLLQVWAATGHPEAQAAIITMCHCCFGAAAEK